MASLLLLLLLPPLFQSFRLILGTKRDEKKEEYLHGGWVKRREAQNNKGRRRYKNHPKGHKDLHGYVQCPTKDLEKNMYLKIMFLSLVSIFKFVYF